MLEFRGTSFAHTPISRRAPTLAARADGQARAEHGFLLIEVIVSALLVAVMVVGTLTGYDALNRAATEERGHDEAILLASQSQQELRSDPASALQQIAARAHAYTRTVNGITYTITQGAELQPQGGSKASCNATEKSRQSGDAYRITSTVTWANQQKTGRPAVVASSVLNAPVGSDLEIDAVNGPSELGGVAGVTAIVTYTGQGGSLTTQEQTTNSEGCALFGAIPATSAKVEVTEIAGYVTPGGKSSVPSFETTLVPNYTTHQAVVYNQAGAIKAEFDYNGSHEPEVTSNNGKEKLKLSVGGDTFVAANNGMNSAPNFEDGSVEYGTGSGGLYEPLPGTETDTGYAPTATTKTNLFPFPAAEKSFWRVYAGDCGENDPEAASSGAVKPQSEVAFAPGETKAVQVPTSYTTLNVYNVKESQLPSNTAERYKDLETTSAYPVTIDNVKCAGIKPINETEIKYQHHQLTSTGSQLGGHLSYPFQPFGSEFNLCLLNTAQQRVYRVKYANTALNGGTVSIFLPQRPLSEVVSTRQADEAAYKAKESGYKAKESAEATAKANYESYKNSWTSKKTEYEKDKTEYEKNKTEYEKNKAEYEHYKTEYEHNKKEYEKTKKSEYQTKYKEDETKYKKYETEYKKYESEYKKYETEYKKYQTEYKNYEAKYAAIYEYKTKYEAEEAAYNTYKAEAVAEKAEYETDKSAYEAAKAEESEGTSVTVEKGTACS